MESAQRPPPAFLIWQVTHVVHGVNEAFLIWQVTHVVHGVNEAFLGENDPSRPFDCETAVDGGAVTLHRSSGECHIWQVPPHPARSLPTPNIKR